MYEVNGRCGSILWPKRFPTIALAKRYRIRSIRKHIGNDVYKTCTKESSKGELRKL